MRRMNREDALWGAPRIHDELLMLGINVAESTVGRYMVRRHRSPSQGWKAFLRNHAAGIALLDLFVVRTFSFKRLYGLVILRQARGRLLSITVTANPTAQWIARQVTTHFRGMNATTSASRLRRGFRRSLRAPHSRHGDPRSPNGATRAAAGWPMSSASSAPSGAKRSIT